jgi:hypothetical protein
MTSVFHQLLTDEAFVDVTLACNEETLKAHKVRARFLSLRAALSWIFTMRKRGESPESGRLMQPAQRQRLAGNINLSLLPPMITVKIKVILAVSKNQGTIW